MDDVLAKAEEWRAAGEEVAIATVVATRRSAPRPLGSKLAVTRSGRLFGSVSGGCVEADVAERCKAVLDGEIASVVSYGIADDEAWTVGLPCGGEIDVFIEPFSGAPERSSAAPSYVVVEGKGVGERWEADERVRTELARRGRPQRVRRGDRPAAAARRRRRRRHRRGAVRARAPARLAHRRRRPARRARHARARAERRRADRRAGRTRSTSTRRPRSSRSSTRSGSTSRRSAAASRAARSTSARSARRRAQEKRREKLGAARRRRARAGRPRPRRRDPGRDRARDPRRDARSAQAGRGARAPPRTLARAGRAACGPAAARDEAEPEQPDPEPGSAASCRRCSPGSQSPAPITPSTHSAR